MEVVDKGVEIKLTAKEASDLYHVLDFYTENIDTSVSSEGDTAERLAIKLAKFGK